MKKKKEEEKKTKNSNSSFVIAIISLVIALFGGVPGLLSIKNEFFKTNIDIEYDVKNTFLAKQVSENEDFFGKMVVGFFGIKLIGKNKVPTSVKSIDFYIYSNKNWVKGQKISLITNTADTKEKDAPCLILGNTNDSFILIDWKNFREFYGDYFIEPGKTLPFNIAFMFNDSADEILKATRWKFILTDFNNKKYTTIIQDPNFTSFLNNNTVLFNSFLEKPSDIQDLLKDRIISSQELRDYRRKIKN